MQLSEVIPDGETKQLTQLVKHCTQPEAIFASGGSV